MTLSARTASGHKVTIEQLSRAEGAMREIAENNGQLLVHHYGTSAEDVRALCELAHECWFQKSKRGGK